MDDSQNSHQASFDDVQHDVLVDDQPANILSELFPARSKFRMRAERPNSFHQAVHIRDGGLDALRLRSISQHRLEIVFRRLGEDQFTA